ncbi:MAG TPA: hypothetical protein VI248_19760, partial [Kineosporiaceae bacterium]
MSAATGPAEIPMSATTGPAEIPMSATQKGELVVRQNEHVDVVHGDAFLDLMRGNHGGRCPP